MKKLVYLIIGVTVMLVGSGGGVPVHAQNIPFVGSAPKAVIVGQQFQLQYTFNSQKGTDLRLDPAILENFNNLAGPSLSKGSSVQIVNGKSSSFEYITYTYVFSAKKEGEFNIPPASIKIGNSEYKSNVLTIKVLPPDKAAQQGGGAAQQQAGTAAVSGDDIFMRMIVSNRSVYEQEGFLVTFKLYTVLNLQGLNNPKFPEFEGFLAQDVERKEEAQWELENYNGRNYQAAIVKQTVLYPQRSGQITIGSAKAEAIVRVRNQARTRNFFEDFFDQNQSVAKELVTPPVTIDVKPLPPGKPASFSGAVGSFTMGSTINKTSLKANEAITIKLTVKGNGNIKLLKTPEIKFPNDFEIYDPKVDNSNIKITTSGSSGTKTIEYMAIPRYAGDFEIPAVEFSFFDTKSGSYKTISSDTYSLQVEKGEGGGDAPVVSNYTNRQSVQSLGKDIRYIKTGTAHFKVNKDIFFGSLFYVMVYLMIAILFAVFFIIYRKQVKENANIALVRTRKANKTAVRRLRQAERLLKESKSEAFYEEVLRALWGYLSDKLNIPPSSLTKDNVAIELTKYGVSDELSAEFLDIINTCEFARYAPSGVSSGMDNLFYETVSAIGNMENTIKK
ncbi:MAG: BatD family protein [Tannerella sp.]|nr:BatD family protein [Tannerella sp.]